MTLTTHHLEFTATARTPLELDEQAGSSVRGALVGGLWERFCTNKAAATCAACPLVAHCPVAALIAPMRADGESGGEQKPRPYVTRPPEGRRYPPNAQLSFGLGLFGRPAELFPYLVMAAQGIEHSGIGRKLAENRGERGRVRLERIAAVNPLTGARQQLYEYGTQQVQAPGLPLDAAQVAAFAATLPADRLTLTFHTPLRLTDKQDGETRLVHRFALRPFVQRLAWRLDELARAYGAPCEHRALVAWAEHVAVAEDRTRWVDVVSYSSRTHTRTPIGGLVGSVTLAGDLAPLRELLVWGTLIHVGKNATKGDGWYTVMPR